jgi:alkanesulfonate monooxygenase SsuD/methylene tetrahydromethanopterin reductase-like flavin-dependent oxidoreductase (luciferase family)
MVPKKIVGVLVLQLLELADAAGFFCCHLAEHHATPRHHRLHSSSPLRLNARFAWRR